TYRRRIASVWHKIGILLYIFNNKRQVGYMSSRQERAKEQQQHKRFNNRIIVIVVAILVIISSIFVFHQLNKQNKIDARESASPVQKHTVANNNHEESRSSSLGVASHGNEVEAGNEITSVQDGATDESQ